MKNKNIVLLVFATVFFVLAVVFFIISNSIILPQNKANNTTNNAINNKYKNTISNKTTNNVDNKISHNNSIDYNNAAETGILNSIRDYQNFSVKDENENVVSLNDYSGKPVYILFFNTTQTESIEMLETLNSVYNTYKDKVVFFTVANIEEKENVQKILQEKSINIPVYYEEGLAASKTYNISAYPTSVIKDKNNSIVNQKAGKLEEDTILANLDILAEKY